jgi:hypothetical protein
MLVTPSHLHILHPGKLLIAIKEGLASLTDGELINVVRQITEAKKGLFVSVSRQIGKEASYLQRVFEGERSGKMSGDLLKAILSEFRIRLLGQSSV